MNKINKKRPMTMFSIMSILDITRHGFLINDEYTDIFIAKIKIVMKDRGVRQNRLANMLGIDKAVVSRVFNKKDRLSLQMLLRIFDAFGFSLCLYMQAKELVLPGVPGLKVGDTILVKFHDKNKETPVFVEKLHGEETT